MAYALPDLPYAYNALEPYISAKTLEFHHDKHHAKYVTKFNDMSQSAGMGDKSIEEVIKASYNDSSKSGLFNNAAQAWNHTFFWNSMKSGGGGAPSGAVADKINSDLGGYDKFKEEFKNAATSQFGSGWAWLVLDNGTLKVVNTANAVNPIALGMTPLLTCDVWEHAYYLDYQNKRPDFVEAFLNNLINWDFVNQQMAAA
ncbi:MAG: superoxide dismutase [Coleofasciculus sp. B1-GNL1-01]|uniref:superoxide dismutase n=1 Tax=Coleofasciculus sp. B1-GNL1-01 TaxID=3068484 RepID=UPI0032FF569B